MTILFNAAGYKPAYNIGGPVQTLAATAERLAARGHGVWVAATDSNLTERLDVDTEAWHDVDGVRVRYFRMRDSWTRRIPLAYFRRSMADYRAPGLEPWLLATETRFDLVHSQLPFVHGNQVCSKYAEKRRIPYVYSQHGVFDPVRLRHRWLKKRVFLALFELPVCRRAAALQALTRHEVETYRLLGLRNRVEVIPNGIDLPEDRAWEWPFPGFMPAQGEPLAIFLARLHPLKGADLAVESFCRARARAGRGMLVVAGPDEYGMATRLEGIARSAGLGDSVLFPGPVSGPAKAALLARADVFMLPTESEGFSMGLLEAMANRCAVLTTPGSYFPEIEEAGAGWLEKRTAEDLAARLEPLLSDPRLALEVGSRARRLVEERYTWGSVVDRLEALYAELAAPAGR